MTNHDKVVDLDLPWRHPGLCVDDRGADFATARTRYLATFVPTAAWLTTLYVHPVVPRSAVAAIRDNLARIDQSTTARLGLSSVPPTIFVHPTVESLHEHSCVGAAAVAYYDGAIHLADVDGSKHELLTSLRHEYTHHVLVSNGIGKPIWFQEGAAMTLAGDPPVNYYELWRKNPIALAKMVDGFPNTSTLEVATVFYAQSYAMTEFLDRMCLALPNCGLAELTRALTNGSASPETLFDWATSRRGSDLVRTARLPLWDDYVEYGNFAPATFDALLRRAGLGAGRR